MRRRGREFSGGSITATRRPVVAAAASGLAGIVPNEGDMMCAWANDLFAQRWG